jgi:hypothetical protein
MKVILTVGRKRRWRADVTDLDLRRDHAQKLLSLRSTGRTQHSTMVCIAGSNGILRIACGEEGDKNGKAVRT